MSMKSSKLKNKKLKNSIGRKIPNSVSLIIIVSILLIFGSYMVFSASYIGVDDSPPWFYLLKHVFFIIAGIIFGTIFFKFGQLKHKSLLIYSFMALAIVLLLIAYIFGETIGGSKRWINLGPINIQPSELLKPALVLLVAHLLTRRKKANTGLAIFISFIAAGLVAVENLSSAILLIIPVLVIFFVYGINKKPAFIAGIIGVLGIVSAVILEPYRMLRIVNFMGVWLNPLKADYQSKQSLYAIADGGIFGVGITNSKQKFFHLPEHHTDFIFAIVGEELGFIGAAILIVLLFSLSFIIIQIALETTDKFNKLTIIGFGALFVSQTILNLAVVTALSPVTGVTLPFISYGGSSIVSFLIIIGFILGTTVPKKRRKNEKQ
ncbi:MAG: FtsW/RodA/SpoVE family cell cycle protein [Fusobacteria bacterium]|nr:FtsW/RodA/SpoVE family cell cycle protein [Fusobacteriota bacterium]